MSIIVRIILNLAFKAPINASIVLGIAGIITVPIIGLMIWKKANPKTGDETPVTAVAIISLIAISGILFGTFAKRKED